MDYKLNLTLNTWNIECSPKEAVCPLADYLHDHGVPGVAEVRLHYHLDQGTIIIAWPGERRSEPSQVAENRTTLTRLCNQFKSAWKGE